MNKLLEELKSNSTFNSSVKKCKSEITPILNRYLTNFPDFTDHSINHSESVVTFADFLLEENVTELNIDEIYILIMASYLHDIGMSPTTKMINQIKQSKEFIEFKKEGKGNYKNYIRQIHHKLTYDYIMSFWKRFDIPNERYAKAIALVAKGHRQEDLMDEEVFIPKYFVRSGHDYVCLPFLAGILRISDELQITNDRMSDLLFDEYLPKNRISRQEWEKHKSSYCVNFTENKIIISAKCNKKIYESMLRHYEKIKNTLSDINKVFKNLMLRDRSLKIKFEEIIACIENEGFIAKNIGFNLDLQNTLDALIGKRLYSNKYVAIREVLQNSIDSCRYKKKINSVFHPSIEVYLGKNNTLIIEDNGLGMDEYIIENFFAKLGSSYYTQIKIKEKFESISEFGIGVFSYFLLCDYFEVETKMDNKSAIKFRVTREADTHFFFYDQSNKLDSGSKVIFFLKEPLSFEELEKTVQNYIRFLEFPIYIGSENIKKTINEQRFEIKEDSELITLVNIARSEEIKNMSILSRKIDKDDYTGICGLILGKDKSNNFIPTNFFHTLKEEKIKISISHKGIFISDLFRNPILHNIIGKINIKKKKELNLSRTGLISGDHLKKIISDFSVEIIEALFKSWKKLSNNKKAALTKLFIQNIIFRSSDLTEEVIEIILKYFIIETYEGSKVNCVSLKSFLNDNFKFILLRCNDNYRNNDFERVKKIYKDLNMPMLLFFPYIDDDFYLDIFNKLNKKITVHSTKQRSYFIIHSKQRLSKKEFFFRYPSFTFMKMNNDWITTTCNMSLDYPLNASHAIVKYLLQKEKLVKKDPELNDLWRQFFSELHDIIFEAGRSFNKIDKELNTSIIRMNKILEVINIKMNVELKISKKDFPSWM